MASIPVQKIYESIEETSFLFLSLSLSYQGLKMRCHFSDHISTGRRSINTLHSHWHVYKFLCSVSGRETKGQQAGQGFQDLQ